MNTNRILKYDLIGGKNSEYRLIFFNCNKVQYFVIYEKIDIKYYKIQIDISYYYY